MQPIYESVAAVAGASTIVDTTKVGMWGITASRPPRLDVRVVHLVRDPVGYVSSDSKPRQRAYPLSTYVRRRHPARSLVTWALQNLSGDLSRTQVDERAVILYRDLVTYPRQTLEHVARIAGHDVDASSIVTDRALTVRTLGHTIGGSTTRPAVGTTEIRNHGPGDGDAAPLAVRASALLASPLWLHYRRAARRSIHHDHELLSPRIGTRAAREPVGSNAQHRGEGAAAGSSDNDPTAGPRPRQPASARLLGNLEPRRTGVPTVSVPAMTERTDTSSARHVRDARTLYPATAELAYFNTAAVGLASRALIDAYRECVDEWTHRGRLRGRRGRG